jgi:hypothetical protein
MNSFRSLLFLACVSFASSVVSAQDSAKVIILSPRIGAVLDRQKRDYFQILMRVNDFESAVFYQSADKRCFAKISLRPKLVPPKDTTIYYPVGFMINISEKIDHFEDLQEGKYHMGAQPSFLASQLDTAGARFLVQGALASQLDTSGTLSLVSPGRWKDEELPFAGDAKKYFFDDFPDWGFGLGYSAYFADLSSITSALTKVESRYRNLGYEIQSNSLNTHVSPLRLLDLKIMFLWNGFLRRCCTVFRHSKRHGFFLSLARVSLLFILTPNNITGIEFLPLIRSINIRPNIISWRRFLRLHQRRA